MKTKISILNARGTLLSLMACGMTAAMAQTIDTSKGTVLDSADTPSGEIAKVPGASKLVASIRSVDEEAKAGGEVSFTPAGSSVNVSGSVDGLEPNRPYQVIVDIPEAPGGGMTTSGPPSNAGAPSAGTPKAGSPEAGPPVAGQPNGESRPGTGASGTSGTGVSGAESSTEEKQAETKPIAKEGDLGMITADSNGRILINVSLRNVDQASEPGRIMGRTLEIKTAASDGAAGQMITVASGMISLPEEEKKTAEADSSAAADVQEGDE